MTIALDGKLVDVGIDTVLDALIEQPGLNYVRLTGPSVDVRIIHIGRGQCIVNDYTRKVRDRIGERLVRSGFLSRSVLVEQLKRQEEDGVRLDFSEYVPSANLDYVIMNQTLDSLDRLSLFPMLDYQIAPQTKVYRGAKIGGAAIRKRCKWIEVHRDKFLLWRQRMNEGRLYMEPIARGLSSENAGIDKALSNDGGWSGLQAALREPLANIALRLDGLVAQGHLHYVEADRLKIVKVDRSRWRVAGFVASMSLLVGSVYLVPFDTGIMMAAWRAPWDHLSQFSHVSHTRTFVAFEVERYRERHNEYPPASVLEQRLESLFSGETRHGRLLHRYQYIGLKDEFVVLTPSSDSDGEISDSKD